MIMLGVIVAIIVIGVLWVISSQRNLVVLDENCNNAKSQIEVNLTSRFDALSNLLDLVKGYNKHEYDTMVDTIAKRNTGHSAKDINENEGIIGQTLGKIVATAEAYPELKSNNNYQNLMNSLNDYENKVRTTRMVYNDCVTKINRTIKMIPTCFIASALGFTQREYLEVEENKQAMPSMK